jgi:proteic killer suppression protein
LALYGIDRTFDKDAGMIKSFKCRCPQRLWDEENSKHLGGIARQAMRKLEILNAAENVDDLRTPPGNRNGQFSIRVNQQYRICFYWNNGAEQVEITDYH